MSLEERERLQLLNPAVSLEETLAMTRWIEECCVACQVPAQSSGNKTPALSHVRFAPLKREAKTEP